MNAYGKKANQLMELAKVPYVYEDYNLPAPGFAKPSESCKAKCSLLIFSNQSMNWLNVFGKDLIFSN